LKDKATALPRGVTSRTVTSETGARTTDEGLAAAGRLAGQICTRIQRAKLPSAVASGELLLATEAAAAAAGA